jgi:hypothetical protein
VGGEAVRIRVTTFPQPAAPYATLLTMTRILPLILLLAAPALAQQTFITPVTSTLPNVAGTGIQVLPIVLMSGDVNVYAGNGAFSSLHCVSGPYESDQRPVWDAKAVDDMAAHLLAGGQRKVVFDYEPREDTELWRMVCLRITLRLQAKGLMVGRYGCDPDSPWDWFWTGIDNSKEVRPIWGPYTSNFGNWEADRTRRLKQVRAAWPNKQVEAWLAWTYEPTVDGDPHSPLGGKYIGADMWSRQLDWCRRNKVERINVFVSNSVPGKPVGPFPEDAEGWQVYKAFARVVR